MDDPGDLLPDPRLFDPSLLRSFCLSVLSPLRTLGPSSLVRAPSTPPATPAVPASPTSYKLNPKLRPRKPRTVGTTYSSVTPAGRSVGWSRVPDHRTGPEGPGRPPPDILSPLPLSPGHLNSNQGTGGSRGYRGRGRTGRFVPRGSPGVCGPAQGVGRTDVPGVQVCVCIETRVYTDTGTFEIVYVGPKFVCTRVCSVVRRGDCMYTQVYV